MLMALTLERLDNKSIQVLTAFGSQPSETNLSFSSEPPVDGDMSLASGTAHILSKINLEMHANRTNGAHL